MKKSIQQITGGVTSDTVVKDTESVSEYKIGHTTYIVTLHFNSTGESLTDVLNRLIAKGAEHKFAA